MSQNPDPSRREFLSNTGKIVVGEVLLSIPPTANARIPREQVAASLKPVPKSTQPVSEFHFGASVYPELQTRQSGIR